MEPNDTAEVEPAFNLLDLDPELLLAALEGLAARDQARARLACKLLYVLIDEISRTTTFMTSALGPLKSVVKSDLAPHLEAAPTLGICFSRDECEQSDIATLAKELPYHLEMIGGHMSVVAGTDASGQLVQTNTVCPHAQRTMDDNMVGLSLGRFPEATVRSFAVDASQRESWHAQLEAEGALEEGWKVFVLVARHRRVGEIVECLQAAHPAAAIIGGIASGDALYRTRAGVVTKLDEGVVGLMLKGSVPLAAFVSRGARGLGEGPFSFGPDDLAPLRRFDGGADGGAADPRQMLTHVTRSNGERLPALRAAIEGLNEAAQSGLTFGLADGDGDGGFELTGLGNEHVVQSHHALVLPPRRGDDPTWERGALRFYSFDPESCKLDLTTRLHAVKAAAEARGDTIVGAVMFTCSGRTHHFFGEAAFDAGTFNKIFTDVPLIGMYAGGEIGPPLLADAPPSRAFQVGGASMHGFTAIFGLFIVPPRPPRASQLAFADDDAVAAAYAEARSRTEPIPPDAASSSAGLGLPKSLRELRSLPVKALKAAMAKLGLVAVPGSEKEDLVLEIANHVPDLQED